jgi:hypothetical protein
MRFTRATLVSLALTALIAGCGSSKSSSSSAASPAPATSKADYVKQINKICTDTNKKSNKLSPPTDPSKAAAYVQALANIGKDEVSKIKAVTPPPELQAGATQAVGDLTTIFTTLQGLLDKHLPPAQFVQAYKNIPAAVGQAKDRFTKTAAATGLTECSK